VGAKCATAGWFLGCEFTVGRVGRSFELIVHGAEQFSVSSICSKVVGVVVVFGV
jgi:hypothetical protein